MASRLEKTSTDSEILAEIGNDKQETALAHIFELLQKQSKRESGILLTNGCPTLFYARNVSDILSCVRVFWSSVGGGWDVSDHLLEYNRGGWDDGIQVFSHK